MAAALYLLAARVAWRGRGPQAFRRSRAGWFLGGLGVIAVALLSPVDAYAHFLLSAHMAQHFLLTMVAAPLLVLGTPVTLALLAVPARSRRRVLLPVLRSRAVRVVTSPAVGWTVFAGVMWGTHLPQVYGAALRNEGIHALEHAAYLGSALLFWWPVIGLDPGPRRLTYPGRILYVFLAMPVTALLGLAITTAGRVLYPYYAAASPLVGVGALGDQHLAGAIMWEGGMFVMVPALGLLLMDWLRRDERAALRADARAAPTASGPGGAGTS